MYCHPCHVISCLLHVYVAWWWQPSCVFITRDIQAFILDYWLRHVAFCLPRTHILYLLYPSPSVTIHMPAVRGEGKSITFFSPNIYLTFFSLYHLSSPYTFCCCVPSPLVFLLLYSGGRKIGQDLLDIYLWLLTFYCTAITILITLFHVLLFLFHAPFARLCFPRALPHHTHTPHTYFTYLKQRKGQKQTVLYIYEGKW